MTELLLCLTLFVAEMLLLMETDQFEPQENKNCRREVMLSNTLRYSFILASYSQSNSKSPNFQKNNALNVRIYFFLFTSLWLIVVLFIALSLMQELFWCDLHNSGSKLYTNLGLLACAPEAYNLPLRSSLGEFGCGSSITRPDIWLN